MLKSCAYCGRIHDSKYDCGKKPKKYKHKSKQEKFRWTKAWQNKRKEIRERDSGVCQVCIRGIYNPYKQYEYNDISIHHAIPIQQDYDKRLDNDNLITLCEMHHKMAEDGKIPYDEIKEIIDEQEEMAKEWI